MKISFEKEDRDDVKRLKDGLEEFYWGKKSLIILRAQEDDGEEYKEDWNTERVWAIVAKPGLSKTRAKKEFGKKCKKYNFKIKDFYKIQKQRLYFDEWEGTWAFYNNDDSDKWIDCWFFEPKKEIRY